MSVDNRYRLATKKLFADEEAVTLQAGYATFILQKTVYKTSVFTLTKNVKVSTKLVYNNIIPKIDDFQYFLEIIIWFLLRHKLS